MGTENEIWHVECIKRLWV